MNENKAIDDRAWNLLNGGVDGELSATEQDELLQLLAGSGDAREIEAELQSFIETVEGLPGIEPPPYLQESIERQIRLPVHSVVADEKHGFFGTWLSANWLRTSFALAAGVLLTVGVYEMGSEPISELDATNLVGTVVKNQAQGQGELLDQVDISNDALSGIVELRRSDDLFTLNLRLNSGGPMEFTVNFAGNELDFEGITSMPNPGEAVNVTDGSINVVGGGEQRYTLKLRRTTETPQRATPLKITFFANNQLMQEVELGISHL